MGLSWIGLTISVSARRKTEVQRRRSWRSACCRRAWSVSALLEKSGGDCWGIRCGVVIGRGEG